MFAESRSPIPLRMLNVGGARVLKVNGSSSLSGSTFDWSAALLTSKETDIPLTSEVTFIMLPSATACMGKPSVMRWRLILLAKT